MEIREVEDGMGILATDEKLAQRIGRELRKACRGAVEYRWSEDTKLLRVPWVRDDGR